MDFPNVSTLLLIEQIVLQNVFFVTDVVPDVCLVQCHGRRGIDVSALRCCAHGHGEAQWDVRHAVDHHAGIHWHVLRYPPHSRLQDVVAVQELLLGRRLDPDLQQHTKISEAGGA